MLEKQPYPWKLTAEEIAPSLKTASPAIPSVSGRPIGIWIGVSLLTLGGLFVFLGWQNTLVQAESGIEISTLPPEKILPLQILPTPNRYTLWSQAALSSVKETPRPQLSMASAGVTTPTEFPAILINHTPPPAATMPINLPLNIPDLPEEPIFNLIGIAQGTDGIVATIKVKAGNTEELKDVRQGAPLLPGYTVSQIGEEYVLLKTSKGGKTLRVD